MGNKSFIYIIDTSSIIDLFRVYPSDVFPKLWENIDVLIKQGRIISHEEVLKELSKKDDDAYKWAKQRKNMFKTITSEQIKIVKNIISKFPKLVDLNKEIDADPWLIALALEKEKQKKLLPKIEIKIIVTQEKFKPNKVNIPFVCREFGIECINILGLMRKEKWKWEVSEKF